MPAQGELLEDTEARAEEEAARADSAADEAGRAAEDAAKAEARIRHLERQVSSMTVISCSHQHHHKRLMVQEQLVATPPVN